MRIHPHDALLCEVLAHSKGSARVLEHVELCPRCQKKLAHRASADRFHRTDYGPVFERSYQNLEQRQAALARERGEAPQLLARLIGLIPERQQLLLRNSRRFQTWGLVELLLRHGENETFFDPAHAEEIFRLALEVSGHLDSSFYGKERIEDIRARTWGYIGNTRRVRMDLRVSEEAFDEAFMRMHKSSDDVMERAVLFDLQASLRRAQRRMNESLRLSERAIAIFRRAGESHKAGKAMLKLSAAYNIMGDSKTAIALVYQSLDLIEPLREPRVVLCALHNLSDDLVTLGRLMEAQKMQSRAQPLYQRFREPRIQGRRRWVAAKIAYGLGRYQEAEALFIRAQNEFSSVGAEFESLLVSQDMTSLPAGQQKAS